MNVSKMSSLLITSIAISLAVNILTFSSPIIQTVYAQANINDTNLKAELITGGLSFPTSMAFLDGNNILVLEKDGAVRLISNGAMQDASVYKSLSIVKMRGVYLVLQFLEVGITLHLRHRLATSLQQFFSTIKNKEKRN